MFELVPLCQDVLVLFLVAHHLLLWAMNTVTSYRTLSRSCCHCWRQCDFPMIPMSVGWLVGRSVCYIILSYTSHICNKKAHEKIREVQPLKIGGRVIWRILASAPIGAWKCNRSVSALSGNYDRQNNRPTDQQTDRPGHGEVYYSIRVWKWDAWYTHVHPPQTIILQSKINNLPWLCLYVSIIIYNTFILYSYRWGAWSC